MKKATATESPGLRVIEPAYRKYASAMLAAARHRLGTSKPQKSTEIITMFDGGDVREVMRECTNLNPYLPSLRDSDYPLGDAKECAKILFDHGLLVTKLSDREGRDIPNPGFDILAPYIQDEMSWPLRDLLARRNTLRISQAEVKGGLRKYFACWTKRKSSQISCMPLYAVRLPTAQILLSNFCTIRRFPDDLKNVFWNSKLRYLNHIGADRFANAKHALFFTADPKNASRQSEENETGSLALTALRLYARTRSSATMTSRGRNKDSAIHCYSNYTA